MAHDGAADRLVQALRDYVDLTEGPPFPRWFVGGELNWTDTVFAPTHDEGRSAVIAENEAGHVETVSYAELRRRVSRLAVGLHATGIRRGDRVGLLKELGVEALSAQPRSRRDATTIMRRVIRRAYTNQDPGDLSSLEDTAAVEVIRGAAAGEKRRS